MNVGYEHDTLDGAPDLMDEEVLQEIQDESCQETDMVNETSPGHKSI